jgi:hypothetical protein
LIALESSLYSNLIYLDLSTTRIASFSTTKNIPVMAQSAEERFSLIKENLAEVLNPEIIQSILDEGRNPKIYWGKSIDLRQI